MALPQAQLGSMPSISLGGYIPAARKDPSVLEQALMAFLGGAAGTAGNRLVDKALPDPQRVASEKLARDKMTMDKEYNDAQLGLGRDRNLLARDELNATVTGRNEDRTSNDNNRKADRDQRDVEEARRTFLALQARLNDTSLAQAQAEGNEATRQEAMRLRAADEERTAAARNAELQARAPLTAAQARLLNAQASGFEADSQRMAPQSRSQAAGEALGIRQDPPTNLDLDELRAIQLEGQQPPINNLEVGAQKVADYYSFLPRKIYETFIAPALQPSNRVKPVETSTRPSYEEQRAIMEQERLRNKMLLDQMRSRGLTELNG